MVLPRALLCFMAGSGLFSCVSRVTNVWFGNSVVHWFSMYNISEISTPLRGTPPLDTATTLATANYNYVS